MREYDTQLLCTFTTYQTYSQEALALVKYYEIPGNVIYALQSCGNLDDVFLTFNAKRGNMEFYPKTMLVHRKKEFNVIYSINALNELVRAENAGILSREYQVDWDKFRNSFISIRDGKVCVTPTKLVKIFRL